MATWQNKFHSSRSSLSVALRQSNQGRDKPLTDCGKGQLFDNVDQAPESSAHYREHLESNFRVLQTICLKVTSRDEGNLRVFYGGGRGGVGTTIKDGDLSNGITRLLNGENLLAPVHRGLEDPHLSLGNDIEPVAGLAFGKNLLSCTKQLSHRALCQQVQLRLRKAGKQGCILQDSHKVRRFRIHATNYSSARF